MEITHLVAFNLALLAAITSPGPAMLYQIRATLAGGRAVGIATGCGLGTMAAGWTLMALVGLDGLFRLFPWAYVMFKTVGAVYLLYIAWSTWRGAREPIGVTAQPQRQAFLDGLVVNLANPKSVLFAAAVLVVVFPQGLSVADKAIIVGNHLLVELAMYTAFALVLSTGTVSRQYLKAKTVLDRVAAVVLGALGLRLIMER